MKHSASPKFWAAYQQLPVPIRELADANFALLKRNPRHPSLQFKKVGRFWSVRVGLRHRALAVEADDGYLWFWIGSHADYDRLIG
ncbi:MULTISPECIES: ParE family toxin-like protein [unclassified Bradyrhizobium]